MHVPLDYKIAPLPITKYNPIIKFGKAWVKRQKGTYSTFLPSCSRTFSLPFPSTWLLALWEELACRARVAIVGSRTMLVILHGQKGKV